MAPANTHMNNDRSVGNAVDTHTPGQEFIAKWREHWPEWSIAEVFVPVTQRSRAAAWFALVQAFTLAAWAGRDPAPGLAKLAWWQDELNGWSKGRRRHPLGEILLACPLPWSQLAHALNGLSVSREVVPENTTAAVDLVPLAQALMACEAALFTNTAALAANHRPTLLDLLAEQSLLHGDAPAATRLLAERASLPQTPRPRPRRLHSAILGGRLQQLHQGRPTRPPSTWRTLFTTWHAARMLW